MSCSHLLPTAPRNSADPLAVVCESLPLPLCALADPRHEDEEMWRATAAEIYTGEAHSDPDAFRAVYRSGQYPRKKIWETAQIAYGLRALGLLQGDRIGLGVGCGKEPLIYFLARHTARCYATDIYGFGWPTAPLAMLHDPCTFAPYVYPVDRLTMLQMNATALIMPAASVDFVYSISSIEHFDGLRYALAHVREAARILKPGGVLAFSTEFVLRRGLEPLPPGADFFTSKTLDWLIFNSGLERIGPLNFTPHPQLLEKSATILLPDWRTDPKEFDCLSARLHDTLFTDIALFLRKPSQI